MSMQHRVYRPIGARRAPKSRAVTNSLTTPVLLAMIAMIGLPAACGPADQEAARDTATPATSPASSGPESEPTPSVVADRELDPPQVYIGESPPPDPEWLSPRATEQALVAADIELPAGFRFEDRIEASGITFRYREVPDAAKDYKPNHYDHGSAVASADVDGDGLPDLYFVNQVGPNELWRNLGDGRFEDITDAAGVGLAEAIGVGASFADVDNDGDADLFATSVRGGNRLFANDGSGGFSDVTDTAGLAYSGHSSGAVFFDFDRDGWLDLCLSNVGVYTTDLLQPATRDPDEPELADDDLYSYYVGTQDAFVGHLSVLNAEPSRLYRNNGDGTFEDVTDAFGFAALGWNGDVGIIDVNGDGWQDIYLTDMQGDDDIFVNVEGEGFADRSREYFPRTSWGAMGIETFDWDNDGLEDIFIVDMHSDMSENVTTDYEKLKSRMQNPESIIRTEGRSLFGNTFFAQRSPGNFEEISDSIGAENYWPWGLSAGDINADGFQDAFIASSMNFSFRYGVNSMLLNDGGERWIDAEFVLGIEPRNDGSLFQKWYTLDCGGFDAGHFDCPEGETGLITRWEPEGSRSSVIVDVDGDGDLDIVTNEFGGRPQVLVSNLAQIAPVNHLLVDLRGTSDNRDGLGASVEVEVGGSVLHQVHDGKSGYLGQSSAPLYFGLGEAGEADEVRVKWPNGREQVLEGPIPSGTRLEIAQPGDG